MLLHDRGITVTGRHNNGRKPEATGTAHQATREDQGADQQQSGFVDWFRRQISSHAPSQPDDQNRRKDGNAVCSQGARCRGAQNDRSTREAQAAHWRIIKGQLGIAKAAEPLICPCPARGRLMASSALTVTTAPTSRGSLRIGYGPSTSDPAKGRTMMRSAFTNSAKIWRRLGSGYLPSSEKMTNSKPS